jgi:hypothetical protein
MKAKAHVECRSKPQGARIYAVPKWRFETGARVEDFLVPEGRTSVRVCLDSYTVYVLIFELDGRRIQCEIDTSKHTSTEVSF